MLSMLETCKKIPKCSPQGPAYLTKMSQIFYLAELKKLHRTLAPKCQVYCLQCAWDLNTIVEYEFNHLNHYSSPLEGSIECGRVKHRRAEDADAQLKPVTEELSGLKQHISQMSAAIFGKLNM